MHQQIIVEQVQTTTLGKFLATEVKQASVTQVVYNNEQPNAINKNRIAHKNITSDNPGTKCSSLPTILR